MNTWMPNARRIESIQNVKPINNVRVRGKIPKKGWFQRGRKGRTYNTSLFGCTLDILRAYEVMLRTTVNPHRNEALMSFTKEISNSPSKRVHEPNWSSSPPSDHPPWKYHQPHLRFPVSSWYHFQDWSQPKHKWFTEKEDEVLSPRITCLFLLLVSPPASFSWLLLWPITPPRPALGAKAKAEKVVAAAWVWSNNIDPCFIAFEETMWVNTFGLSIWLLLAFGYVYGLVKTKQMMRA